jgi:drug/metabolite transporter (DMT)-like permease
VPDAGPFGPGSGVIALGLLSALLWGAGDFGGGLATRRSALFGVVIGSQVVGVVIALGLAAIRSEPVPGLADAAWSVLAGVVGALGITNLYHGLAVGRMGVVAPLTGVIAAAIPVGVGIATEGMPPPIVSAGIAVAVVAVVLVTRTAGDTGRRSGVEFGLLAGFGIGLFNTTIAQVTDGLVFGPLAILRTTEALTVVVVVLLTRSGWRVGRPLWFAVLLIGVLDMGGNGAFILATQSGSLAVAAVLSSLYPVTTILLALVLLRERMTAQHAVGVAAAVVAIGLIASGSAG